MNDVEGMSYNPLCWARMLFRTAPRIVGETVGRIPLCCGANLDQEIFLVESSKQSEGAPPIAHEGLLVVLHGFRQSRASLMRNLQPIFDLHLPFRETYVPHVNYDAADLLSLEGNAALLAHVREFCDDHPQEPILLLGMSAGGRLAVALQNALRYVAHTHIHTVTLVAPLGGSQLVRMVPGALPLWQWLIGPFADQLDPQHESQRLVSHMLAHAEQPHRTFAHFYSVTDYLVFPPSLCVSSVGTRHVLRHCAHGDALTHPDVIRYLGTFLFPPVQVHGGAMG